MFAFRVLFFVVEWTQMLIAFKFFCVKNKVALKHCSGTSIS